MTPISNEIWYDTSSQANLKLSRALSIVSSTLFYQVYVDSTNNVLYFATLDYSSTLPQITLTVMLTGNPVMNFEFRMGKFTSGSTYYIPGFLT